MKCDYQGTHHGIGKPGDTIECPNCSRRVVVIDGHGHKPFIAAHQWPENINTVHYRHQTRGSR